MKPRNYLLTIIVSCMTLAAAMYSARGAYAGTVTHYRAFFAELHTVDKKLARIAMRKFTRDGREYYLAVDPVSLRTELVPVGKYLILKLSLKEIRARHAGLSFCKALRYAEENSKRIQNAGLTRVPGSAAVYVSADLCPTKLPLDREFFTRLTAEYGAFHRPVPVALSVTGAWLEKHPDDVQWLKDLESRKSISILWVNHTKNHKYKKKVAWWKNFLADKKSDLDSELLENEAAMIGAGLLPSVFFRFPGLVSNRDLFFRVTGYGLIPLGCDAWLGKKQWPGPGSIILVHANGQEPVGIKRFLWVLGSKQKEIAAGRWVIDDLANGVRDAMKMY